MSSINFFYLLKKNPQHFGRPIILFCEPPKSAHYTEDTDSSNAIGVQDISSEEVLELIHKTWYQLTGKDPQMSALLRFLCAGLHPASSFD
jgi:hypothetical protein